MIPSIHVNIVSLKRRHSVRRKSFTRAGIISTVSIEGLDTRPSSKQMVVKGRLVKYAEHKSQSNFIITVTNSADLKSRSSAGASKAQNPFFCKP